MSSKHIDLYAMWEYVSALYMLCKQMRVDQKKMLKLKVTLMPINVYYIFELGVETVAIDAAKTWYCQRNDGC